MEDSLILKNIDISFSINRIKNGSKRLLTLPPFDKMDTDFRKIYLKSSKDEKNKMKTQLE